MKRNDKLSADDSFVNSIIGEGTHFRGHLELSGLLRIDGDFSGSIRTSGKVIIGKNGRADCTIDAGTVVVGGAVRGNVYAEERVIVLASAMLLGNIYAPNLVMEEGVVFDGHCEVSGRPPVRSAMPGMGRGLLGGARGTLAFERGERTDRTDSGAVEPSEHTAQRQAAARVPQ